METSSHQPAIYDFYSALQQLQLRAGVPAVDDHLDLFSDVGALISNVEHLFPGDSEALNS